MERITTIVGDPGTGKSRLARSFMRTEPRLILLDTMLEHDEFVHVDLYELRELIEDDMPFRVRIMPRGEEQLTWVCALAAWRPHMCIVIEEYNLHWRKAQTSPPDGLFDIVRAGRKLDQSAIFITQAPTTIDKTFLEFGTVYAFALHGLRSRKYIRDLTDGQADPGHLEYVPGEWSDVWRIVNGVPERMRMDLRTCELSYISVDSTLTEKPPKRSIESCDESGIGPQSKGDADENRREARRCDHGSHGRDAGAGEDYQEGGAGSIGGDLIVTTGVGRGTDTGDVEQREE